MHALGRPASVPKEIAFVKITLPESFNLSLSLYVRELTRWHETSHKGERSFRDFVKIPYGGWRG